MSMALCFGFVWPGLDSVGAIGVGGIFEKLLAESIPASSKPAGQGWASHLYDTDLRRKKVTEVIVCREEWDENK